MTVAAPAGPGGALGDGIVQLGLSLGAADFERIEAYLELLRRWGRVYNLTAIRTPDEIVGHHLLDSLSVVAPLRRLAGSGPLELLDVGSGAGLPGALIAIAMPGVRVTCVDSVGKKAAFVQQVAARLRLDNLRSVHARVQSLNTPFDVIVSRAFASLADFASATRHLARPSTLWLAMKGRRPREEIENLPEDFSVFHVEQLEVPGLHAERCLVVMRCAAGARAGQPGDIHRPGAPQP